MSESNLALLSSYSRLCALVKPEEEHLFVMDLIKNLEKHASPKRRAEIKKLLMSSLKKYISSESRQVRYDIFPMWKMLAEYSGTMNLITILNQVHEHYQDYLPYYQLYISELLRNEQIEEAKSLYQKYANIHNQEAAILLQEFPTIAREIQPQITQPVNSVFTGIPTKCIEVIISRYRAYGLRLGSLLSSYFGIHMIKTLEQFAAAGFVHNELSPSTVVVIEKIEESMDPLLLFQKPMLKFVPPAQRLNAQSEIGDHFGFIRSMGYMVFQDEFEITQSNGMRMLSKVVPRRYFDRLMWSELFDKLLNGEQKELSDWGSIGDRLMQDFLANLENNVTFWRNSVLEFNRIYDQIDTVN